MRIENAVVSIAPFDDTIDSFTSNKEKKIQG